MNDDIKKWKQLVETYSTLHAKNTEKFESPDPNAIDDPVDSVCVDIPLLIRLMEFSREDAVDDQQLHKVAERCIALNKQVETLTMKHYDQLTAALTTDTESDTDIEVDNDQTTP